MRAGAETGEGCLRNERHYEDHFTAARVADANVGHGGLHGVKAAGETLHDEFWGSSRGTEGLLGMHSVMDASSMPLNCVTVTVSAVSYILTEFINFIEPSLRRLSKLCCAVPRRDEVDDRG